MPRSVWRLILVFVVLAVPARLLAQPAFLVEDVNQSGPAPSPVPANQEFTGLGTNLFFVYNDGVHGFELWKSDGTGAGTTLVTDLCPGICASHPTSLTVFNGLLFFFADDGVHGREIWKSDGTVAGTTLVKDIQPGLGNREPFLQSFPGGFLELDGFLYFSADDGEHGQELWKSDGTSEGTVLVRDINPGPNGSFPRPWVAAGGILLLNADDGTHGREPWVSDGTEAGTNLIKNIHFGSPGSTSGFLGIAGWDAIAAPGGGFLFQAEDGSQGAELWKTDGTEAGTTLVKDIKSGGGSEPAGFTALGAAVYFSAGDSLNGRELWKTDGTEAGTTLVKDIYPGDLSSSPAEITVSDGRLFFRAADAANGLELWSSDGTEAETLRVKDVFPGPPGGLAFPPNAITAFGGGVLFVAHGTELWRSDGTEDGTVLVPGGYLPPAAQFIQESWAVVGSTFFFSTFRTTPPQRAELWTSDGVSANQVLMTPSAPWSIRPDLAVPYGRPLVAQGGRLLFTADQGITLSTLWSSDVTPAGTILLDSGSAARLTPAGGLTFLSLDQFPARTDGTPAGTQVLSNSFSVHGEMAALGSSVLFSCQSVFSPAASAVLCKSDGTPGGTGLVAAIEADPLLRQFTASGSDVFFVADSPTLGEELWKSNGTEAGTMVVRDIWPDGSSSPDRLTDVAGTLFFSAATEAEGRELWKSDGTEAGTVLVKDIRPGQGSALEKTENRAGFTAAVGGTLYFVANDGTSGSELWKSDGTAAGTVLVKDIAPGSLGSGPFWLTRVGDRVYFAADDGTHGRELWVSDGTAAGTRMVADILPGAGSSVPQDLQAVGHILLFAATDGVHGLEVWRSNGVAVGTRMFQDIAPGALPSSPTLFTPAGSHIFFAANDTTTGFEPWAAPRSAVLTTFGDVPADFWAWSFIEALAAAGLTVGCGPVQFCPETQVNRSEIAVFLVRGTHGLDFFPPPATGTVFQDVAAGFWAAPWIEQLAQDGFTSGCSASPPLYCPAQTLTRAEMAVFLLRARHGNAYTPPAATGTVFGDVPSGFWAAPWIEQLAAEGITAGCAPGLYCPGDPVTRAQAAVFLTRTFNLTLP